MDMPNYSGDQLATIASFRTRAGELADLLETIDLKAHTQECYAEMNNECATPCCALGWAVHRGKIPGVRLALLTGDDGLTRRGVAPDKLPTFEYTPAYIEGPGSVTLYEVPGDEAFGTGVQVFPVNDEGVAFDWNLMGVEHYGSVVANAVFLNTDDNLFEVIAKLRQYAATGTIQGSVEEEEGSYYEMHYHMADEFLSHNWRQADE